MTSTDSRAATNAPVPAFRMRLRVTHVLRTIGGEWWLVHRHADFPPADQRG